METVKSLNARNSDLACGSKDSAKLINRPKSAMRYVRFLGY